MLTVSNIVDAIYRVEGGAKTKHPYGILSVHTSSKSEAREVCARTVRHAERDFRYDEKASDRMFITFLADRYCPASADPQGNKNWKVNMIRILRVTK